MPRKISKNKTNFMVDETKSYNINWWYNQYPKWEGETFEILDMFSDKNKYLIDIGTWIGPTVLYSANKYEHIYGFECDNQAYNEICSNISVNKFENITMVKKGISNKIETQKMIDRGLIGNSVSTILDNSLVNNIKFDKMWDIKTTTLEKYFHENNINKGKISLIKMDIEGGEYNAIKGMINYLKSDQPNLYISLHYHLIKKVYITELIDILLDIYPFVYSDNLKQIDKSFLYLDHNKSISILLTINKLCK